MGPEQVLPLWLRVDLGVMTIKEYFTFPKSLGQEPHHQMQFSVISQILIVGGSLNTCKDSVGIFYSPS